MKKLSVIKRWYFTTLVILFAVLFTACPGSSNDVQPTSENEEHQGNEEQQGNVQNDEEKVYDSYIIDYSLGVILLDDVTKEEFDDFKTKITISPNAINKNPKQIYSVNENKMTLNSGGLKKFFSILWTKRYGSDQDIHIMMVYHQDGKPDKVFKFASWDEYAFYKDALRVASTGKSNDYHKWDCSGDDNSYYFWFLTDEGYDRFINERWRKSDPIETYTNYTLINAAPYDGRMGLEFELWISKYDLIEEEDYFVDNKEKKITITASGRKKFGDLLI